MREGREPARGRDTRHVLPSLAGAPAGKAPACGRLLPPCAGLALALPAGETAGTPARRRRSPRPAARECAGGGACAASARGGLNCGPPQGQGRRPQGAARLGRWKRRGPRPRYAGRRVRRQSRAARPAPQAWPGWQGWPECRRPGRRGGRPHSPHIVGAGPPRSTNAATGAGLAGGKAREAAPQGLGLAAGLGGPAQRLAANLTGTRRQARPWPPHFPDTPQAWPGGRRHRRRTGWAGWRPAGRRGGWDAARRTGPRTGAPFPGR